MKPYDTQRIRWMAGIAVILATTGSFAQVKPARRVGLLQYLQISHSGVTRDLIAAAELMPAADYEFKPSTMAAARTFSGVIAHATGSMFDACARLKGVTNPTPDAEKRVGSKAEVVETLRVAVSFCSEAVTSLDEAGAASYVAQGPAEVPRSAAVAGLLAHNAEMFGISTVYLRAKNLVPPGSR
jgi:hypothetical protein